MATFAYRAIDRSGTSRRGEIEARDRVEALAQVKRIGATPVSIVETAAKPAARHGVGGSQARIATAKAAGELGVLLGAGLPLDRALSLCLENIEHVGVKAQFAAMLIEVRQGVPLSRTMASRPAQFPGNARAMIEAGEANGRLADALARVERMFNQTEEMRRLVVGAMIYPAVLLGLAVAVILLMLLYVVPQFEAVLTSARGDLPASSRALLSASRFLRDYWLALLLGVLVVGIGVRQALARPAMRQFRDRLILRLPQLGPLVQMLETARLARTLGGLVEGGVAVPDALAMASRSISNAVMAQAVAGVAEDVRKGASVTARMAETQALPRIALGFLRTGEETSQLGRMLERLADVLERDVTFRIQRLVAVLTPLITVLLGGSVATIIASIMSAIIGFNDLAVSQ